MTVVAYIDIETNYVGPFHDKRLFRDHKNHKITIFGIYKTNSETGEKQLIQLIDTEITTNSVIQNLCDVDVLVTYNGRSKPDSVKHFTGFDFPVINAQLGILLDDMFDHVDLCPLCWQNGYKGGLKKIEGYLGITRNSVGIDGNEAIGMWRKWKNTGDIKVLNELLFYNYEDIVNLEKMYEVLTMGETLSEAPEFEGR